MHVRFLLLGAALVPLLDGCRSAPPAEPILLPVSIHMVAGSGPVGGPRYSAGITPDVQVDAAFKVGGYVEQVLQVRGADGRMRNVQDGDHVARGTVLARVREREYRDAVTQAQASLDRSKADFDRAAQLYENKSISKSDYDAAFAKYQADQAEHDRAVQSLTDCTLIAPLDGYVLKRNIEVGTLVSAGSPGFSIGNMRSVKVVFGVPDVVVSSLKPGAPQRVTVEAVPGQVFLGRFTRVAPTADPTSRMFEAEVTIPNGDGRLKAGMIAALELEKPATAAAAPALLVPLNAVVRPPGSATGFAVFVVESAAGHDVARLHPVELGDISGNMIQVTRGLGGGERVIVRGATLAVDSQVVRIIP
jgi:RND family efflux transporter MFP subunit